MYGCCFHSCYIFQFLTPQLLQRTNKKKYIGIDAKFALETCIELWTQFVVVIMQFLLSHVILVLPVSSCRPPTFSCFLATSVDGFSRFWFIELFSSSGSLFLGCYHLNLDL
ncbi:hypothetical protein L1987_11662 [Smallanthus sonchifolius]|uniref:Uncharacterized protein n=1 Tax=Smallanthus sonchifolius TaxID=185202 RepID=A0ACB9JDU9_9ASTR|nr:hypothetical protein L1987_11662 [Smallanthus sonchifolius]